MNIIVNYDLLQKISEAKYGFSLVKTVTKSTIIVISVNSLIFPFVAATSDSITFNQYLELLPFTSLLNVGLLTSFDILLNSITDEKFFHLLDLAILSRDLGTLNVDTSIDLLMEAEKYHTEYEVMGDNSVIPHFVQKKYINIPTSDDEEVSIVQEHVIGSDVYTLSKGHPKKQRALKFAYGNS